MLSLSAILSLSFLPSLHDMLFLHICPSLLFGEHIPMWGALFFLLHTIYRICLGTVLLTLVLTLCYLNFHHLSIINNLPETKIPGPCGYTNTYEFYQILKKEIMSTFCHCSRKQEQMGTLPNLFCVAKIILISKPDKGIIRNKSYPPISLINRKQISSYWQIKSTYL